MCMEGENSSVDVLVPFLHAVPLFRRNPLQPVDKFVVEPLYLAVGLRVTWRRRFRPDLMSLAFRFELFADEFRSIVMNDLSRLAVSVHNLP